MRVAILAPSARQHDAIGNLVAEKLAFFHDRGADVRVFLDFDRQVHPSVRPFARTLDAEHPSGEGWDFLQSADLVSIDFGHGFRLMQLLPLLESARTRILLDDHGVTPTHCWPGPMPAALLDAHRDRGMVWFADHVTVNSQFIEQELVETTGYPSARISRLGLPVFHDVLFEVSKCKREEHSVLFVGRIAPNKRLTTLVEALARLPKSARLTIIGDDTDVYEHEANRVRARAGMLGVSDRIRWLGRVDTDRLIDAYRRASVFVMPSIHEGFCAPIIEAMAAGLPVIAAHAGALPETVGSAGLLFSPDDPDDLANTMQTFWRDTALRDRLVRDGRRHAESFRRDRWRHWFGEIVEMALDAEPLDDRAEIVVSPIGSEISPCAASSDGWSTMFLRASNEGRVPVLAHGPGRTLIHGTVEREEIDIDLPAMVLPGETVALSLPVRERPRGNSLPVTLQARRADGILAGPCLEYCLNVRDARSALHDSLAEIERRRNLPADYADHSEGWFAPLKRWIKRKLLHNFRHSYVDVLSRQQSSVNHLVLGALTELAESCTELRRAHTMNGDSAAGRMLARLEALEGQWRRVDERLARIETMLDAPPPRREPGPVDNEHQFKDWA